MTRSPQDAADEGACAGVGQREVCTECWGSGNDAGSAFNKCPLCKGTGSAPAISGEQSTGGVALADLTSASEVMDLLRSRTDPMVKALNRAQMDDADRIDMAYAIIADRKDRAALSAPVDKGEAVALVLDWLSMAEAVPLVGAGNIIRYPPICQTELDAIRYLALKGASNA